MSSRLSKRARTLCAAALLALPAAVWAGDGDDFGWQQSLEFTKRVAEKIDVTLDGELRTFDNASAIDRASVGAGVAYKPLKFLRVKAGYEYQCRLKPDEIKLKDVESDNSGNPVQEYNLEENYTSHRHRLYLSVAGVCKVGRVSLSLRERFQYTHSMSTHTDKIKYRYSSSFDELIARDPEVEEVRAKDKSVLRSRLMAKWDIRKCKFKPYAAYELSHWANNGWGVDKQRLSVGTVYKMSKNAALDVSYLYQRQHDDDEADGHFICAGVSIDF